MGKLKADGVLTVSRWTLYDYLSWETAPAVRASREPSWHGRFNTDGTLIPTKLFLGPSSSYKRIVQRRFVSFVCYLPCGNAHYASASFLIRVVSHPSTKSR